MTYRPRGMSWDDALDYFIHSAEEDANGCLIPAARAHPNGYVRFTFNSSQHYLHRAVLERELGRPLLPGMDASHTCHNRACANAGHLVEETRSENVARAGALGRMGNVGENHNMAKLTEDDVREIREMLADGHYQREVAEAFGVGDVAVSSIKTGKTWRHVA